MTYWHDRLAKGRDRGRCYQDTEAPHNACGVELNVQRLYTK